MYEDLRRMGAPLGISFGHVSITPNTHLALEASEYARDDGRFHSFHERVFQAYFGSELNIGRLDVILEIGLAVGLDPEGLRLGLLERRYAERLQDARREGERLGVTAVPTFVLGDNIRIVGVQPIDVFRQKLSAVQPE